MFVMEGKCEKLEFLEKEVRFWEVDSLDLWCEENELIYGVFCIGKLLF